MGADRDVRTWLPTDRAGERMTIGQPLPGLEILSARASERHWSESTHETFTVAAIHRDVRPTGAEWRTRGKSFATAGGQMMNINAGDGHRTFRVHAPSAFDVIKFPAPWLNRAATSLGAPHPFRFARPSCENATVFDAIERVVHTFARGATAFEIETACHDVASAIVTGLSESPPTERRSRADGVLDFRLRRAREYLMEHPNERPSLEELERDTGLCKSQLCALFKKEYGASMGEFWMGCRVAKARALLLQGLPATRVAVDLGFTDQPHFSRVFSKHNGLPPASWVRIYRSRERAK